MQESFDFGSRPRRSEPARESATEPITLTVAALNSLVKDMLEARVPPLWVEGEISGWKQHSSGHRYFCLKDAGAQVNAVMWAKDARRLPIEPEHGMRVRAFGAATLYEKRGDFQFVVKRLEATGDGGLWRVAFERLRTKLEAEGLLAPARKRALPQYPRAVGIVTSAAGAALHDILHVIRRRAPWTRIVLSPARVQGEGAAWDIAAAIHRFTRAGREVDVIIVGRGGGSVEDLWAFNEEAVARAIANAPVPVISAVGHEVDSTIADLVADLRAPTPSAAAEYAVPDGALLRQELGTTKVRLARALRRYAVTRREQLQIAGERLEQRMQRAVRARRDRLAWAAERLEQRMRRNVHARRASLARLAGQVEALSPLQALARGYAVPLDAHGRILRRREQFPPGVHFDLRVADGTVHCRTEESESVHE
ncbi:MAG TPA: exodeoxyribonuclease VII large subunit [Longimicrobiales bacterium]|nr:exodeoxyribonuclease VII large subunit [Longimicrobiales bacterium]